MSGYQHPLRTCRARDVASSTPAISKGGYLFGDPA